MDLTSAKKSDSPDIIPVLLLSLFWGPIYLVMDPNYFRGVTIGLLIVWVTSAIAYYVVYYVRGDSSLRLLPKLIIFELVVSVIIYIAYLFLKQRPRRVVGVV